MRRLSEKQEKFCIRYLLLDNASEAARQAGYSAKWAGNNVPQLLRSPAVKARLEEFRQIERELAEKSDRQLIMSVDERKRRLSEIARARLTDFMELGQDGSWVNIGPETENSGAVQEIHSRTEYDEKTSKGTVYTSVKLHDPMKAIDLLNKMEKMYSDGALVQDNRGDRIVNIFVVDNEARDLITQVAERARLLNADANDQSIQGSPESMGGRQEGDIA